ncbi:MAG: lipopolysaccharide biosynthesis protein RfbH [Cellulosilyticaceae bacterium]
MEDEKRLRGEILKLVEQYYNMAHKETEKSQQENNQRIVYGGRVYDAREMKNLVESALDFWLTSGRYVTQFEAELSKLLEVSYCYTCNSGSSANLLAFMALTADELGERRIRRGDEVITIAAGFPTTVTPILQYGAVPVFVDITIPEYNIDVGQLEIARTDKTKAVMVAHTLGNPFAIEEVLAFCKKYQLWLIEDNCDALGSRYCINGQWRYTGTWGDIGTSSFYPPHHMTMGEGGAVYTQNPLLAKIVVSLRDWGRDCSCPSGVDNLCGKRFSKQYGALPFGYDHKYVYGRFGYNLKITEMQAAIGCAQLEKLPEFITKRQKNWEYLRGALECVKDMLVLPNGESHSEISWFGFLVCLKENAPVTRDQMVAYLEGAGIQTRMLFAGNLIKHPCFDRLRRTQEGYRQVGELTNTDYVMNHGFWIGVYPGMTPQKLDYMIDKIKAVLKQEKA